MERCLAVVALLAAAHLACGAGAKPPGEPSARALNDAIERSDVEVVLWSSGEPAGMPRSGDPPFDKARASKELTSFHLSTCVERPGVEARLGVAFAPDGSVERVLLTAGNLTAAERECCTARLRQLRIPPFDAHGGVVARKGYRTQSR